MDHWQDHQLTTPSKQSKPASYGLEERVELATVLPRMEASLTSALLDLTSATLSSEVVLVLRKIGCCTYPYIVS